MKCVYCGCESGHRSHSQSADCVRALRELVRKVREVTREVAEAPANNDAVRVALRRKVREVLAETEG